MGNIFSVGARGSDRAPNGNTTGDASTDPLFLEDMEAQGAEWSREGTCTSIQRFLGMLPDSQVLKQDQRVPLYAPRVALVLLRLETVGRH
ncbi:hypothetical protein PINS_up002069 [Pythium insidiosum]|nr:hypothetical protein PINS_up002069 [Pythium insidiosum]